MSILIVSYAANGTNDYLDSSSGNYSDDAITFTPGSNYLIDSLVVSLAKIGSPSATITAYLYAVAGTPGSNAVPTGSPLATSSTLNASSLTTSLTSYTFTFSGVQQYHMTAGTTYFMDININGGNPSNAMFLPEANSTAGQNNASYLVGTGWQAFPSNMLAFAIYGDTPPVNNSGFLTFM